MDSKKLLKTTQEKYICEKCDYNTSNCSNYYKHLSTRKHKMIEKNYSKLLSGDVAVGKPLESKFSCICGKSYKYDSGYYRHIKLCNKYNNKTSENQIVNKESTDIDTNYKNMFVEIMKQNKELQSLLIEQQDYHHKEVMEMIPKLGNNNNNTINQKFNLQVFLNEECKDALNISDFIESLKIQLSDLEQTKNHGLVNSISALLINGLNGLEMNKRPIHCTDSKRDVLYIKDAEKWEKDKQNEKMITGINELANKQRMAMKAWTKNNPNWRTDEKLKDEYVKLMHEVMEPLEESEKDQNRIIKSVGQNTYLEQKDLKAIKDI